MYCGIDVCLEVLLAREDDKMDEETALFALGSS
jgi:hypothetical protein